MILRKSIVVDVQVKITLSGTFFWIIMSKTTCCVAVLLVPSYCTLPFLETLQYISACLKIYNTSVVADIQATNISYKALTRSQTQHNIQITELFSGSSFVFPSGLVYLHTALLASLCLRVYLHASVAIHVVSVQYKVKVGLSPILGG